METPILFLIFNRPDTTMRVFQTIRDAKPKNLFIAADGPRKKVPSDKENTTKVRSIIEQIDWPCEVRTLFRDQNLGCRNAVSSGITWFFNQVEEGIILEDDTLPHPDFFSFAQTMLEKYRNEENVMHLTGGNYQFGQLRGDASYYFSRITHVWGWASWRRAWQHYDVDMKDYPDFLQKNKINSFFPDKFSEKHWLFFFKKMYSKRAGTWDYQWNYAVIKNHGYCIIPNVNLISNIGFGGSGTHSLEEDNPVSNLQVFPLKDIIHPKEIHYCEEADQYTIKIAFPMQSMSRRIYNKINKTIKQFVS